MGDHDSERSAMNGSAHDGGVSIQGYDMKAHDGEVSIQGI